ncbi:MAG: BolA/IbaG family iron-sulfur metabolism protein [Halioglobus sp.]|nr:BolA/IbaG family iron-sulfur metabolism protein [Halioglobus sp.]
MIIQQQIEQQLQSSFAPAFLEVFNESHMHSVSADSETHFRVVVVSSSFDGFSRVARHQQVYAVLAPQLAGPVHALALHTHTAVEWEQREQAVHASPKCLGGSKPDQT